MIIKNPWRFFIIEAFLFSLILFLGVITAIKISHILSIEQIIIPQVSFWRFIISFILITLIFIILIRVLKFRKEKKIIFKLLFIISTFLGGIFALESWLGEPISLILLFVLIFLWLKKPSVLIQDNLIIIGMVGVGSILGLGLKPEIIIPILVVFSIYDYIAVYKTKHMVEMAKSMIESRAILGLIIPQNVSGFWGELKKAEPGSNFFILGGGDIVLPLIFSVSLISTGILNSFIVAIFSLIGFSVSFLIFATQKKREPIPALPPIVLFSLIGYLISLII